MLRLFESVLAKKAKRSLLDRGIKAVMAAIVGAGIINMDEITVPEPGAQQRLFLGAGGLHRLGDEPMELAGGDLDAPCAELLK